MSTKIWSAALCGLDARIITVEASAGGGDFGRITIVGLPDATVSESKERVRSALRHCGLPFPRRKITVNLAPASLKKKGAAYDLPIAVSILTLSNNFTFNISQALFAGELSLTGDVRPLNGVLSIAIAAKEAGLKTLFVPVENGAEAGLIAGLTIYPTINLQQLISHLRQQTLIKPQSKTIITTRQSNAHPDFADIKGQEKAKRALEIAAAGGHNILLTGPPGSGKTMLSLALPGILPPLTFSERIEITRIYSAAGELKDNKLATARPFRAPHHNATANAIIGGGSWPCPGEISLAHRGILFLDEFPEFSRSVIESLRQPLENGYISINRAAIYARFPARFILAAAMNPCPCGYKNSPDTACACTLKQIYNYQRRLSGPIMDRIDIHLTVKRTAWKELASIKRGNSSTTIRRRVEIAGHIQKKRFEKFPFLSNSEIPGSLIKSFCPLLPESRALLDEAGEKMKLSARSYFQTLKIARTIADLAEQKDILTEHIAEALQYRHDQAA